MWKNLSRQEQNKLLNSWIKKILKDETSDSINQHIIKHVNEIFDKDPEQWSASMRNLLDIFNKINKIKPNTELRLERLNNKYSKNPKRVTSPPNL